MPCRCRLSPHKARHENRDRWRSAAASLQFPAPRAARRRRKSCCWDRARSVVAIVGEPVGGDGLLQLRNDRLGLRAADVGNDDQVGTVPAPVGRPVVGAHGAAPADDIVTRPARRVLVMMTTQESATPRPSAGLSREDQEHAHRIIPLPPANANRRPVGVAKTARPILESKAKRTQRDGTKNSRTKASMIVLRQEQRVVGVSDIASGMGSCERNLGDGIMAAPAPRATSSLCYSDINRPLL